MRIVAGKFGGRVVQAPKTNETRPMSDKVRGALFDILGPIDGFVVLDAYAGSGAVGFEALSRGAQRVLAIESGRKAINAIIANIEDLDASFSYQLAPIKVESWLARNQEMKFDLIVVDPPYESIDEEILEKLADYLAEERILVLKNPRGYEDLNIAGVKLVDSRDYGDQKLAFYRKQT